MKGFINQNVLFSWLPVLFYSCSETKSLEEGQYLYNGAQNKYQSRPALSKRKTQRI